MIRDTYISYKIIDNSHTKSAEADTQKTLIIISDNFILNFYDTTGNPVDTFESPVKLNFIIRDSMLLSNDLSLDQKQNVFVYHYDDSLEKPVTLIIVGRNKLTIKSRS
jgi:hypothetical protein